MDFDKPPPEPLASAPGFLLSWHGRRTAHAFAENLRQLGLKPPHFGVLRLIAAQPGSTQQELVERSMIDPSSMVAVIDELEELGLAERHAHEGDRRKHAIELTPEGERTLKGAQTIANQTAETVLGPLNARERKDLLILLRKLAGLQ